MGVVEIMQTLGLPVGLCVVLLVGYKYVLDLNTKERENERQERKELEQRLETMALNILELSVAIKNQTEVLKKQEEK